MNNKKLSGVTKFMIVLCCVLTFSNIVIIIWGIIRNGEVTEFAEKFFNAEKRGLFSFVGAERMFDTLKESFITIVFLLINISGYIVSYYIGKWLDHLKSVAEFFIKLKEDGWGYFLLMLYNILSWSFDLYSIYSFII